MKLTVIVSAYDNWRQLDWTLEAFRRQSEPCDELIVTEDSAFPEVADVVARHAQQARFPVRHLTQDDLGFRKCLALNRAIDHASGDFVVFTDADCVPRDDLLAAYRRHARPGIFLSGGSHVSLPEWFHREHLTLALIASQQLFNPDFLAQAGVRTPALRLTRHAQLAWVMDRLTPRNAFVGCNSAAWRADLQRVHGFDESMGYGAEDRNLGYRLNHAGVQGVRLRHSLVWLHLDHPRGYLSPESVALNRAWNAQVRKRKLVLPRESMFAEQAA